MSNRLPRTKRPIGFSLEYNDWVPGELPHEVVEHFDDRTSAQRRVHELSLRNYAIWHSDGYMAVTTDVSVSSASKGTRASPNGRMQGMSDALNASVAAMPVRQTSSPICRGENKASTVSRLTKCCNTCARPLQVNIH